MADIERYGGKVTVEAGSSPTGHTIHMTSNQSWLKVYQDNQSTAIASAGTNYDADDRTATVSITATTVSDPSYQGTASVTCGWTVTQEGTGSTPPVNTVHIQWQDGLMTSNSSSSASYGYDTSSTGITCSYGNEGTSLEINYEVAPGGQSVLYVGAETGYDVEAGIVRFTFNDYPLNVISWSLRLTLMDENSSQIIETETISNGSGTRTITFTLSSYGGRTLNMYPYIDIYV